MTDKSDIEALASAIYATANQFDAHRGELPAGYEDWADEIARDLRAHVEAARRLQPARVTDGWVSPFGSCICNGMNQCPGCNPNEAIKMAAGIAAADERAKNPPCMECGARTAKEAETMCHCSGDKDDCHGCQLWPDGDAAPQPEAAQTAGEVEEVGAFGERFIDGMGWAVPCSRAAPYVAAMRKAALAMAGKEAGAYVGAGAHGIPDEPAPSAPADVEADIQKLESYLDDAGYPKDGDAQLTLESLAARLASAPQPTQRGGEGVEAVKQSLTGGGKNE